MKREIKFKIWDKITKRWLNANEYARIRINPIQDKYGNGFNLYDSFNLVDDIEIVEYTGLKDKNGKEIYEGDIVKVPAGWGDGLLYNSFIGEIQYDAPNFYVNQGININKTGKWSNQEYKWEEIEIIGNIYENPELLES